jgi:hypothetical protein
MADITKSATSDSVTFSANSPRADAWMMQRYDDVTITLALPARARKAQNLEVAARAAGFTISTEGTQA